MNTRTHLRVAVPTQGVDVLAECISWLMQDRGGSVPLQHFEQSNSSVITRCVGKVPSSECVRISPYVRARVR